LTASHTRSAKVARAIPSDNGADGPSLHPVQECTPMGSRAAEAALFRPMARGRNRLVKMRPKLLKGSSRFSNKPAARDQKHRRQRQDGIPHEVVRSGEPGALPFADYAGQIADHILQYSQRAERRAVDPAKKVVRISTTINPAAPMAAASAKFSSEGTNCRYSRPWAVEGERLLHKSRNKNPISARVKSDTPTRSDFNC
jgi:hypothetical protein